MRKLKLTASNAQRIGNNGKGLESLVQELMAEYLSSAERKMFSNEHIDRGHELEAVARDMYELDQGVKVLTVGFIEAHEHIGFSPDGLIGEEGGVDFKCPDDLGYYRLLLKGESEIDTKYIWQVQMSILLSGRQWWDLAFYNPNFEQTLLIFRILPDEEKQKALIEGLEKGVESIKSQLALFTR